MLFLPLESLLHSPVLKFCSSRFQPPLRFLWGQAPICHLCVSLTLLSTHQLLYKYLLEAGREERRRPEETQCPLQCHQGHSRGQDVPWFPWDDIRYSQELLPVRFYFHLKSGICSLLLNKYKHPSSQPTIHTHHFRSLHSNASRTGEAMLPGKAGQRVTVASCRHRLSKGQWLLRAGLWLPFRV